MITRSWLDDPSARPPLAIVPEPGVSPAFPFRQACLPEYRRRLLAVYGAVAGWPPERTAGLHAFVEAASRAFDVGAAEPWLLALAELERRAGLAS